MNDKPKMGWLYWLIALCVLFSGVMAWGLVNKLADQRDAAETYAQLSQEVVVTGSTAFTDEADTPAPTLGESEAEAADQQDTVQFLESDIVVVPGARATLEGSATASPAPAATATPAQTQSAYLTLPPLGKTTATSAPAVTATPAQTQSAYLTLPPLGKTTATSAPAATPAPSASPAAGATGAAQNVTPATSASQSPQPGSGWVVITPAPGATGASLKPGATLATPSAQPSLGATPAPAATTEPWRERVMQMDNVHYSVDFGYLQGINEDVKAWLVQDGTVINYPVLQGKDNETYLNRLFNGRENKDGSLFLDSGSSAYFDDANSYIYGHHTKTDAMFSTLANYRDQAYYEAHPQMILLTPYSDYRIDLFAARVCAVDDETSWRVKQFTRKAEFTDYLETLEKESLIRANADALPEWGDQLLVLVTCTNDQHGERYVVYGRMRPIAYTGDESVNVTKMKMDSAATISGWREVPGRGLMMVYAQNDPLWANMRYESRISPKHRVFGEGGCGPTSVAMAVVNLVPKDRLADIYGYAKSALGYTFCECSVNQYFCNKLHAQYQIQTADEYLRYYPLVMANFATGNNLWQQISRSTSPGTVLNFLRKVAYLYKLDLRTTYDNDEALAAVKDGAIAIASLGSENPFTKGGHYVVVASVDEQNLYLLDPYRQENYDKTDTKHILNTLSPGVVSVRLEDMRNLSMATFYILNATPETLSAAPPAVS